MRNFPNLIDAYLEYTSGHEGTPLVHKWSFVSVLAAALERRVWLDRGYYTLFPNLFVFIIGRSGLIKKSTTTGIAVNMFRELDGHRMMSERITAAALIHQMAEAGKKSYWKDGKRFLQSPLFCYASELSVTLTEVFGSITELLTTFYDCQPNDSSKPWTHKTVGGGEVKVFGPCLNILGASTKAWLSKCIPKSEIEGGFTSRVIFVVEDGIPEKLVAWPTLEASGIRVRSQIVQDLGLINRMHGKFYVCNAARQYFQKWYEHHMLRVIPNNTDPKIAGYMGRKGDTVLKLAMIYNAATSGSMEISEEGIKWGLTELEQLEPLWRNAFEGPISMVGRNYAFEIQKLLQDKGKIGLDDLRVWFGPRMPAGELTKAIEQLIEMGEVTLKDDALVLGTGSFSFD